jgi:hypothetical protein
MKRSRDLNQSSQKVFSGSFDLSHTLSQCSMSRKEFPGTIASQARAKFSFNPNQFHPEARSSEGSESCESRLRLTPTIPP